MLTCTLCQRPAGSTGLCAECLPKSLMRLLEQLFYEQDAPHPRAECIAALEARIAELRKALLADVLKRKGAASEAKKRQPGKVLAFHKV